MLSKDALRDDLTAEKPQWILSAYAPGKQAPVQLFGGPDREQSFEEMRLLHYNAVQVGTGPQEAARAEALYHQSNEQIETALRDLDGALKYVINADNSQPSRVDVCKQSMGKKGGFQAQNAGSSQQATPNPFASSSAPAFGAPQPVSSNPFGASSQPTATGAFGQPATLGQTKSAFGAPSGGASGQSAFGQPSVLGAKPNPIAGPTTSTFGAPSAPTFGQSAFGAPSQLGGGSAFGQPSTLGQTTSAFGAPSTTAAPVAAPFSAFSGTPSAFGQKPPASGGFGQPAFGQPSLPSTNPLGQKAPASGTFGSTPAFGQPAFGAPSLPGTFGQPSVASGNAFGQPTPVFGTPPAFGQPQAQTPANPFAGPQPVAPSPFGAPVAPSVPATTAIPANPFAPASAPQLPANVFVPATGNTTGPANPLAPSKPSNPFGMPQPNGSHTPATVHAPASLAPPPLDLGKHPRYKPRPADVPDPADYISTDPTGKRLIRYKGEPVVYEKGFPGVKGRDGFMRIWCPTGYPKDYQDTEGPEELYDAALAEAYAGLKIDGRFTGDVMPMCPPRSDWCRWDI